jgi:hypothetical protein
MHRDGPTSPWLAGLGSGAVGRPFGAFDRRELGMGITIGREQRDAIYQEVVLDLNGLTDLWTEFDEGNFDRARELRDRFVLDMRLLDDLGWEAEPESTEFELTMDGVDLAAVVSYLIAQTGAILRTHIVEPIEQAPHAERSVTAQTAFGSILAQLAQGQALDEQPRDLPGRRDR